MSEVDLGLFQFALGLSDLGPVCKKALRVNSGEAHIHLSERRRLGLCRPVRQR